MLSFRFAREADTELVFEWSNDPVTRQNSYAQEPIVFNDHVNWFLNKLNDSAAFFYIFQNELLENVGLVRIEKKTGETVIGILIDKKQRGKALAVPMLEMACADFFSKNPHEIIHAYIKVENIPSLKAFQKAGFTTSAEVEIAQQKSYLLTKKNSG